MGSLIIAYDCFFGQPRYNNDKNLENYCRDIDQSDRMARDYVG